MYIHRYIHVHTCVPTYMYINTYMYMYIHTYIHTYILMFSTSLYGTPLAQRASYLALHSSIFVPDGAVNYDYIVTNSINTLLIGSRSTCTCTCTCIPNGTH